MSNVRVIPWPDNVPANLLAAMKVCYPEVGQSTKEANVDITVSESLITY